MGMKKVSVTLDDKLVVEAKSQVDEGGFSRILNDALALYLQRRRLEALERELAREFGPIPDEVRREVEAQEWPK